MIKLILGILLTVAGVISELVLSLGKKELVSKMFLIEPDAEDYKKIRLFGIIISGIMLLAGITLFILGLTLK